MSQTVVQREPFTSAATYTSGAPGGLGTVTGTFYRCAAGPRLTSDTTTAGGRGCSADLRQVGGNGIGGITNTIQHVWTVSGASQSVGMFSAWYYIAEVSANGSQQEYLAHTRGNSNQCLRIFLKPSSNGNFWYNGSTDGVDTTNDWLDHDSGVACPTKQWFELRHSWRNTTGTTLDYKCAYRLAGSSTWVTIYAHTFSAYALIDQVRGGVPNEATASAYRGRYGMPSLVAIDSISERVDNVIGVTDPPTDATGWYVSDSGSSSNFGNALDATWDLAGVKAATRYGGILPGDTVYFANGVPFGSSTLDIATSSSTWDFSDATPLFHEDLTGWTQYDSVNFPRIWKVTPATGGVAGAMVWEDLKWMNRAVGADITAVRSTMNTNAGGKGYSYADATTIYLVTSDNSNPNTNGRTYSRSFNRVSVLGATDPGASAIVVAGCSDVIIENLYAPYARTTLARGSDADPYNGYVVQWDSNCGGTLNELRDCALGYWSKHPGDRTTTASNMTLTLNRVDLGPGSPYVGFGGQSALVSFADSGTGNKSIYRRVTCDANIGNIGAVGGVANTGQPAWLSHSGVANAFSLVEFDECRLCSTLVEQGGMTGGVLRLRNTTTGTITTASATLQRISDWDRGDDDAAQD